MIWLFLEDPEIELTNNFAESQIKHFAKYRKNSLCTWLDIGDRFLWRVKSLYASSKLQTSYFLAATGSTDSFKKG